MASDCQIAGKGRPTEYTEEIGDTICERIADGERLRTICTDAGMPDEATVLGWISSHGKFRDEYEIAREFPVQALLDETIEIIDDTSGYLVERVQANGRVVVIWDRKQLPRCVLRCEVRTWVVDQLPPLKLEERLERMAQQDRDADEAART
ncbi:MAG: terminase small subunit protein [Xanthobacteraceae bacterium]